MQMTGASFSEVCTRPDESWISYCNGYIQAVIDSMNSQSGVCLPSGTSRTDLVMLAERAITTIPELHEVNAFATVRHVIEKAYKCEE